MKNNKVAILIVFAIIIVIDVVSCITYDEEDHTSEEEDHTGEAMTPASSYSMEGLFYEDVEQKFANAGFTNIQLEEIDDLITGFITEEGDVKEVSVGGDVNYDSGEWMPADTKVIIRYHVFSKDSESSGSDDSTEGEEAGDDGTGEEESDTEFGEEGTEIGE